MTDEMAPESEPNVSAESPDAGTFTFRKSFSLGRRPANGADVSLIPGTTHSLKLTWGGAQDSTTDQPGPERQPATYYEALSGRPDPMRDFFVTARRMLNLVVTIIAIGIPVGLVTLGLMVGADFQAIVFMGIFGLIVGLMIKTSFPRTTFG
jgi:hypothetical protein